MQEENGEDSLLAQRLDTMRSNFQEVAWVQHGNIMNTAIAKTLCCLPQCSLWRGTMPFGSLGSSDHIGRVKHLHREGKETASRGDRKVSA